MIELRAPRLDEIVAAADHIREGIVRTPLIRLAVDDAPAEIWLKLENLQPIGSFKLRGAGAALAALDADDLVDGVYTASAGNMAQGVAFWARRREVPCRVVVPNHAPDTKLAAIERLGGEILKIPFDEWWSVIQNHGHPDLSGHFIHPVSDPAVLAGNATIGLEILDELPTVDTILAPYGGGGLSCGIAAAVRARGADVRVLGCEVETAAPLAASLLAGTPVEVERKPSFVDGIGGTAVLEEMWPLVTELLAGALVVTLQQTVDALRLMLERHRVLAEGAGAVPLAAALAGGAGGHRVVCVISGGNLDSDTLAKILAGQIP